MRRAWRVRNGLRAGFVRITGTAVLRMNGDGLARGVEWRFACKPAARVTDAPMSAYTRELAASRQHDTAGTAAACSTRWRAGFVRMNSTGFMCMNGIDLARGGERRSGRRCRGR